jgi:clan AA aspartic protease
MPQESGSVNALREAIVTIRFAKGEEFDCLVDTGFDGALMLPAPVVARLKLSIVARLVFELAGGARMAADVALAEVEWLGGRRDVEVIVSQSNDALMGTELFEDTQLVIDYRKGLVIISRHA